MWAIAFLMNPADLYKMINKTRFAMSNEDARYSLNGIHLHVKGNKLCAVATDGRQLARVEFAFSENMEPIQPITIPRWHVENLRKFLKEASGLFKVVVRSDDIEFTYGRNTFRPRLLDATFPDYERIIPTDNDRIAVVAKRSFQRVLKRITPTVPKIRQFGRLIRPVTLTFADNQLTINEEKIDCDYKDEPIELTLNARYLLNVTRQIDGSRIRFELKDNTTPVVIKDGIDSSVLFLVMPEQPGVGDAKDP